MSSRVVSALIGEERPDGMPFLDGLRGVAALMVFTRHAWSLSGRPTYEVPVGVGTISLDSLLVMTRAVDLFFVLSAFLLGRSFMVSAERGLGRPNVRRFYRQRAWRIVPAYWVVLLLLLTMYTPWLAPNEAVYSRDGLFAFVGYIPMLSTILPWSFGRWIVIGPLWTLTHEITLYLLLPFVYRLFARGRWRTALPCAAAITTGWLFFIRTGWGVDLSATVGNLANTGIDGPDLGRIILVSQFPAFVFSFALGLTLAAIWAELQVHGRTGIRVFDHPRRLLVAGLIVVALSMLFLGRLAIDGNFEDPFALAKATTPQAAFYYYTEHASMAIGFSLILAGLVFGEAGRRTLEWGWIRALGIIGYGIFLAHFPVLFAQANFQWLARMPVQWHFPAAWILGLGTTVLFATLSWFALERPLLARARRTTPTGPVISPSELAGG